LKKLAAILLIALFIFNLFGYRILYYFAQQESDINLEKAFDKDQYSEEDLITIKIPISVPYQVERKDFERFDGEIKLNGKIYKYVKRKVCDGNLVLLCLPDHNKMRLETAKNDLFKNSNDLQNTSSKKQGNSKRGGTNLSNEYNQSLTEYRLGYYKILHNFGFPNQLCPLPSAPHGCPVQPPELS